MKKEAKPAEEKDLYVVGQNYPVAKKILGGRGISEKDHANYMLFEATNAEAGNLPYLFKAYQKTKDSVWGPRLWNIKRKIPGSLAGVAPTKELIKEIKEQIDGYSQKKKNQLKNLFKQLDKNDVFTLGVQSAPSYIKEAIMSGDEKYIKNAAKRYAEGYRTKNENAGLLSRVYENISWHVNPLRKDIENPLKKQMMTYAKQKGLREDVEKMLDSSKAGELKDAYAGTPGKKYSKDK